MVQLAVTTKNGEWTIFRNGKVVDFGMSRSRAIEAAEGMAQIASNSGDAVELLIQDYTGELSVRRSASLAEAELLA
jgi:hypothetical protein